MRGSALHKTLVPILKVKVSEVEAQAVYLCPYEYSYTPEEHLNVTEKWNKMRTYVVCETKIPCPCSKPQPGARGQFKGPSGAFVTYCNISCFSDIINTLWCNLLICDRGPDSQSFLKLRTTLTLR